MRFRVVEKNGNPRAIESIRFDSEGRIDMIDTVDPETGHDPASLMPDDVDWDIDVEEEDIEKVKLNLWVLGEKAPFAKFGLRLEEEKDDSVGQDD